MKFALVVPQEFKEHYSRHSFEISGLLNWAKALGGDVLTIDEDLTPYDALMTNISSTETEYVSLIRQENRDASLVVCFDYGWDVVGQYFQDLYRVRTIMSRADHVFSVNRNQRTWISSLLGIPVALIHHPTDAAAIAKFRKPPGGRGRGVAAMWHQYDNQSISSLVVLQAAERLLGKPLLKMLVGLKPRHMLQHGMGLASASLPTLAEDIPNGPRKGTLLDPDLPQVVQIVPAGIAWDGVLPYTGVEAWYDWLSGFDVALDLYTVNSIGRFGLDCAAVGIPLVASHMTESSLLYPFTSVDPYEPSAPAEFISRLVKKPDFAERVVKTADKNLEPHFGLNACREKMLRMLGEKG